MAWVQAKNAALLFTDMRVSEKGQGVGVQYLDNKVWKHQVEYQQAGKNGLFPPDTTPGGLL